MKVTRVEVMGQEYDLCLSARVFMKLESENASLNTAKGNALLLSALMEAGDTYTKNHGQTGKGFMTIDEILDCLSPQDIKELSAQMIEGNKKNEV